MVFGGVKFHYKTSPLLVACPFLLKMMTLKPHPHLFAPPSPLDMTTVRRHFTKFSPKPSPTRKTCAKLFIFSL